MLTQKDYIGKQLEGYRLTVELASSPSSRLFLGEAATATQQLVICKFFHGTHINTPQSLDNFLREVTAIQDMRHTFLLPILAAGLDEEIPYIITQFVPAGSLQERIQNQSPLALPVDDALTILNQIGQALQYAHLCGTAHGAIKPSNILFNAAGQALLTDFYLSSAHLLEDTDSVKVPKSIETLDHSDPTLYRAPEEKPGKADAKSDQYTLACIAYEMLTGRKPFTTPSQNNPGIFYKTRVLAPLRTLNASVPRHVEHAILKGLAKDPTQRHTDIQAFLTMLSVPVSPAEQNEAQQQSAFSSSSQPAITSSPVPFAASDMHTFDTAATPSSFPSIAASWASRPQVQTIEPDPGSQSAYKQMLSKMKRGLTSVTAAVTNVSKNAVHTAPQQTPEQVTPAYSIPAQPAYPMPAPNPSSTHPVQPMQPAQSAAPQQVSAPVTAIPPAPLPLPASSSSPSPTVQPMTSPSQPASSEPTLLSMQSQAFQPTIQPTPVPSQPAYPAPVPMSPAVLPTAASQQQIPFPTAPMQPTSAPIQSAPVPEQLSALQSLLAATQSTPPAPEQPAAPAPSDSQPLNVPQPPATDPALRAPAPAQSLLSQSISLPGRPTTKSGPVPSLLRNRRLISASTPAVQPTGASLQPESQVSQLPFQPKALTIQPGEVSSVPGQLNLPPQSPTPISPATQAKGFYKKYFGRLNARQEITLLIAVCSLLALLIIVPTGIFAWRAIALRPAPVVQITPTHAVPTPLPTQITVTVEPTLAPSPTTAPTPKPTPTPQVIPTATPTPVVGLNVAPTNLSNNNCTRIQAGYTCVVTLSLSGKAKTSLKWSAFSTGVGTNFAPVSGTIRPGQTTRVTITIFDNCTRSGTFTFTTPKGDVTATWAC